MPKLNYVTKDDLENSLEEVEKRIKKAIVDSEVKVLGELQKTRENDAAHAFSHMRISEDFDDHEKRISKLETAKA